MKYQMKLSTIVADPSSQGGVKNWKWLFFKYSPQPTDFRQREKIS